MTLYHNSLGGLEPHAGIGLFGDNYGKGGYLLLSTTSSDNPHRGMRWDNVPGAAEAIAQWASENGYDIKVSQDGYGTFRASLTHRDTAAAQAVLKANADNVFAGAERGFLRYGEPPVSGYSGNAVTGRNEPGVSVFEAEFATNGEYRPLFATNQQLGSYLSLLADGRTVYRVWGDVVGCGGDGEPCLRVTKMEALQC